jgi:hypothetical protein
MIKYQAPFRLINNAASSAKLYLELNLMEKILRLGIMYHRLPAPYHQSWYFYLTKSGLLSSASPHSTHHFLYLGFQRTNI